MIRLLFFLIITSSCAFAQVAEMNFALQKKLSDSRNLSKEISLFVKGDPTVIRSNVEALGGTFKYSTGDISAVRMPLGKVTQLAGVAEIKRIESNDLKLQPM